MDKQKLNLKVLLNNELHETSKIMQLINWKDPTVYSQLLAQTYYYVCHSSNLLKFSAAKVDQNRDQDLYQHLMNHIQEENHHELLCVSDLKKMNLKIDDFTEFDSTKTLYQIQYYSIEHLHELSFFGYVLFLETLAITHGKALNQFIINNYIKSPNAFLKLHAEEDISHSDRIQLMIHKLSPIAQKHIYYNLKQSAYLYRQILIDILNESIESSHTNDHHSIRGA